ncbi:MAG: hypothetical protein ACU0CO_07725 [Shimia sp.]
MLDGLDPDLRASIRRALFPYGPAKRGRVASFCIDLSDRFRMGMDPKAPCPPGYLRVTTTFSARGGVNDATMTLR